MIYFGQSWVEGNKPTRHYDEMWTIMRYPSKGLACTTENHVELAPSAELYALYQNVLKNNWNERTFEDQYLPIFMKEHQTREFKDTMNYLYNVCTEKDIILMCSCAKDNLCHRSIIRGMLGGALLRADKYGKRLNAGVSAEYTIDLSYYDRWKRWDYYARPAMIVAGSRTFGDYAMLCNSLDRIVTKDTILITGHARGADALAERYASERGLENVIVPAEWDLYGKSAGYRRNEEMHYRLAKFPNRKCICFWDGQSKGTAHNFELGFKYGTEVQKIMF